MSADSLKKQSKQLYQGQVVLPQPINDISLIESVAGFIQEVVPQRYGGVLNPESKDVILWARFESADYNDPENYSPYSECESEAIPPLLLVLGYSTGVQVWSIGGSGEATELFSWCQGAVKTLRFLLRPQSRDPFSSKRPLVAIVDSSSEGKQFATVSIVSLRTKEVVRTVKFHSPICDVYCNRKSLVVTLNERIAVFDSASFEDRLVITTCYPSPGISPNPIAFGTRWLAYGDTRLISWLRSSGGCESDGGQSYTSTFIHAARSLGKGLLELGSSWAGSSPSSHNSQAQPGIVSIIDIDNEQHQQQQQKSSNPEEERGHMIAHFVAHTSAIVAMTFDPSGQLIITADEHGHKFHVFRIYPHPCTSQLAAVHHIFILHRGETTARVQDLAVSWDSRWVAVSSVRGTTHVFPITPYGGIITARTHATLHVANKLSTLEHTSGAREVRGFPQTYTDSLSLQFSPRLPPYPHPLMVNPLAQLKARPDDAPLGACFGPPRAWLPGWPKSKRTFADSLYVLYSSGAFLQYDLDPKPGPGPRSYCQPIELGVEAKAEWTLPKPPYSNSLSPPLPLGHLLLDPPSRPHLPPDKWHAQVETETHYGPHRRIFMGPQFEFVPLDRLPVSCRDDIEITPESGNPLRSSPINTPHRAYLHVDFTSSAGSASPKMGDLGDARHRLVEDLAEAMLETHISSGQAKGKLRKAEFEWQVNPLGAVQTHPPTHSYWPHPIFFEPYSQGHYKAMELPSHQKSVEGFPERVKLQDLSLDASTSQEEKSPRSDLPVVSVKEVLPEAKEGTESLCVSCKRHCCSPSKVFGDSKVTSTSNLSKTEDELLMEKKDEHVISELTPSVIEVNIPLSVSSKSNLKSDSTVFEPLHSDEKSSSVQDTEEKPKSSGRRGKKKKNGNDRKTKKELGKPTDEIQSFSISESHKMEHHNKEADLELVEVVEPFKEVAPECSKCEDRPDTVPDVLNITDELRGNPGIDQLLFDNPMSVGEDPEIVPALSDLDQDLLMSDPKPNIACDPLEVTEDIFLIEGATIPLLEDTLEITGKSDSSLNNPSEFPEFQEQFQIKDLSHSDINFETTVEESPEFSIHKPLLKEDLDHPPLAFIREAEATEPVQESVLLASNDDMDLNGNSTIEEQNLDTELLDVSSSAVESPLVVHEELANLIDTSNPNVADNEMNPPVLAIDPDSEFIPVPSKVSRSKNRRRKKEKKVEDVSQSEVSELEFPEVEPVGIVKEEFPLLEATSVQETESTASAETESVCVLESCGEESLEKPPPAEEHVAEISSEQVVVLPLVEKSSMEGSLKSTSLDAVSSLILSDDVQSDQITSTDKSEIEDVSSHSGKESDDSKINKKERSRKQKRSESSDKDRSDLKKKSPSPATTKSDNKDSESSDDAGQLVDNKQPNPKAPKRKKGKKNEETILEVPSKGKDSSKECSILSDIKIVPIKSKNSESSLESSGESRPSRHPAVRSWSHSASNSEPQCGVEDRDSVYESCNDDGASDSLAFESSKEDFDDSSKNTATEPSSSNTEERADTSDKTIQPLKKVRKQKKKKR